MSLASQSSLCLPSWLLSSGNALPPIHMKVAGPASSFPSQGPSWAAWEPGKERSGLKLEELAQDTGGRCQRQKQLKTCRF